MKDNSYCNPDVEKMKAKSPRRRPPSSRRTAAEVEDIVFCELTDEPTGQPLEFAAKDPAYARPLPRLARRRWARRPADLLVPTGTRCKIVTAERAARSSRPSTTSRSGSARGRSATSWRRSGSSLEEAYGGTFPVLANFSDGAVYSANFYAQGVDYFELLDSPDQNAIWGEDWANGRPRTSARRSTSTSCAPPPASAGQLIGHHLIAYAGRKPWDVKLKATSELARGVKILNNFCYGPSWATHEGGPVLAQRTCGRPSRRPGRRTPP